MDLQINSTLHLFISIYKDLNDKCHNCRRQGDILNIEDKLMEICERSIIRKHAQRDDKSNGRLVVCRRKLIKA